MRVGGYLGVSAASILPRGRAPGQAPRVWVEVRQLWHGAEPRIENVVAAADAM